MSHGVVQLPTAGVPYRQVEANQAVTPKYRCFVDLGHFQTSLWKGKGIQQTEHLLILSHGMPNLVAVVPSLMIRSDVSHHTPKAIRVLLVLAISQIRIVGNVLLIIRSKRVFEFPMDRADHRWIRQGSDISFSTAAPDMLDDELQTQRHDVPLYAVLYTANELSSGAELVIVFDSGILFVAEGNPLSRSDFVCSGKPQKRRTNKINIVKAF